MVRVWGKAAEKGSIHSLYVTLQLEVRVEGGRASSSLEVGDLSWSIHDGSVTRGGGDAPESLLPFSRSNLTPIPQKKKP